MNAFDVCYLVGFNELFGPLAIKFVMCLKCLVSDSLKREKIVYLEGYYFLKNIVVCVEK